MIEELELVTPVAGNPISGARKYSRQRDNLRGNHSDHFQTPPAAILPLLPYISEGNAIWDPACGKGNIVKAFSNAGYESHGTDILDGYNFLTDNTPLRWIDDPVIVTNPPYSIKDEFIAHCYDLNIPFALLMPLTALEGLRRQSQYREHGLQLMVLPKRINFETPNMGKKGKGAWFATAWYCWKMDLPNDLYFSEI